MRLDWRHGRFCRMLVLLGMVSVGVGLAFPTRAHGRYFTKTQTDANVYVAPVASSISKVAILPFQAPTELIGSSISDILVTEMLRAHRYTLVERNQMDSVLGETEFALSGLSESAAIEVGKMLGAEGVILGTVDEYATVAHRGRAYPVVGASIRLIDCDSGRVLWSVDHARRAHSPRDTLSGHARDVVHEMVSAVVQNWNVQRQIATASDDAAGASAPPRGRFAPPQAVSPAPPVGLTVSDFGLREVALQWPRPADRSLHYRIERAGQPEGPFEAIATLVATRGSYTDAGTRRKPLNDAATYYYRLVAIDRAELESAASLVIESMTAPPPAPPVDLVANAPSARAVSLEWTPPPSEGVTRYRVERADGGHDDFVDVGDVSNPSFSEGGTSASPLRDSRVYRYRVRSINRVGAVGDASAVVEVKTLPPPKPPTGLTAQSLGVRCVLLAWDIHPGPDIIRYAIYRADGAEGPFSRLDTVEGRATTTYLDGGQNPGCLDDDQSYFYRIRAINTVLAESAASKGAHATTRPPPPVVEGLAAITGLPRRVELSWRPSSDNAVIAYELERAEADGDFQPLARVEGLDAAAYTDMGDEAERFMRSNVRIPLKDGTAYAYRIRAINTAEAASDWCEAIDAVTKIVPQPPTGLRVSTGHARVIGVAWNANREKDIIAYGVEMAAIEEGPFTDAGRVLAEGQLRLKQDNLPPGLSRFYRVQAVDIDGLHSEWTEPEKGTTKPLPEAPTDLTVEWGADGAWVRWSPPPHDDIVHYRILNRRFMGQDELAVCETAEYFFPMAALAKKKVVMITAVDADGLESSTSHVLEIKVSR